MRTASSPSKVLRIVPLLIVAWIFYGGVPVRAQAQVVYEVTDLGTLGIGESRAESINDAGQIVGSAAVFCTWEGRVEFHATLFDPTGAGNNIDLGTLGHPESEALCINSTGRIVGISGSGEDWAGGWRATLFDATGAGNNIALGTLGGDQSWAECINEAGQIVGSAAIAGWALHATIFDPNGAGNNIDLGTLGGPFSSGYCINDSGQIVGEADSRATLFDPTGAGNNIDLGTLGGGWSRAQCINEASQIVGWEENSQGDFRATLFDATGDGNNLDLGTLGGDSSRATSINDAGQIVGVAVNSQGYGHATLFDQTGAGNNIDLNTLIDPASGWTLLEAYDINNSGWIVGQGINPQGESHAFLLVPVYVKYSGGTGTPDDPYQIATAEDLIDLGESPEDYDKHFILTADIDLDPNLPGRRIFDRAVIAPDINDTQDYFQGTGFTGVFDGNDHTISNLTIIGGSYVGLFGQLGESGVHTSEVKNLGVVDVNIACSGGRVGGLVGVNSGRITRSYIAGMVSGTGDYVGGLAGRNHYGTIRTSYSTGYVDGGYSVGGLVGDIYGGSVSESYSISTVTGAWGIGGLIGCNGFSDIMEYIHSGRVLSCYSSGAIRGGSGVGGLVGYNEQFSSISTSRSTCTVSGDSQVGGLVGDNWGTISNSYSTGAVSGDSEVGGLVGWYCWGGITNCYGTGLVSGTGNYVGGLVGLSGWDPSTGSFWDMESSGRTASDGGIGKTTAEMQMDSTFLDAGWDFINVWGIGENQTYPYLRKYSAADVNQDGIVNLLDLCIIAERWMEEEQ